MNLVNFIKGIFQPRDPRRKILLWATIVAVFCGIVDIGQPVDMSMQIVRNIIRKQPVSGDIVIVGVDDKTLARLGTFPFSNGSHAKVLNTLSAMGAKSVHYDTYIRKTLDPAADNAMADALRNARMPVTLPVGMTINPQTGKMEETSSAPMFTPLAEEVSIAFRRNFFGHIVRIKYYNSFGDHTHKTMAARIAGVEPSLTNQFLVDYSYDVTSIKPISFLDVVDNKVARDRIAGKKIIIAPTTPLIDDIHRYLGEYPVPGAYIHLVSAELLKKGVPIELAWMPTVLLGFLFAVYALRPGKNIQKILLASLGFPILFFVTLLLETVLISSALFPAYVLIGYAIVSRIWIDLARKRGYVNANTGLFNFDALRDDNEGTNRLLIVLHVRNFDRISSLLGDGGEVQLISQIIRRLDSGGTGITIYQTGLGRFAWMVPAESDSDIGNQIDGTHSLFHMPFELSERRIDLDVCFGIDTNYGRSMSNRYASARLAADLAGRNGQRWTRAAVTDADELGWQLSALGELDAAIDNGQLWVAYQPQLDLKSNALAAAEALVRWSHPTRGDIRPDEFIKMAEDNNRIDKLTRFVLREAIATAAEINRNSAETGRSPFRIAVNVSARMLDDRSLIATLIEELANHAVAPAAIVLELTESGILRDNAQAASVMHELRIMGIGISLDDYGTGYSTLGYLRDMPANEVKIDRRFVQSVAVGGSDALMVKSTIELAHSMNKTVVAEGIEDAATLEALRRLNCDMVQGFFIGKPVRREQLIAQLHSGENAAIQSAQPAARSAA